MGKPKHVQITLDENMIEKIEHLKDIMILPTRTSVIREAIKLTLSLTKEIGDEGEVFVRRQDGTEAKLIII